MDNKCIYPNCIKERKFLKTKKEYSVFCEGHIKAVTSKFFYIYKYGEIEGENKYNEYVKKQKESQTLSGFIKRYGKSNGEKKYNERNKKISNSCILETYIKKYGEIEGKKRWEENNKKKAVTLEHLIKKYGEIEGKKRWEDYIRKQKNYTPEKRIKKSKDLKYINSIDYYIDKHGEKKGKIVFEKWKKSQDHLSLDFFIKKYGEVKGNLKYKEICKKIKDTRTFSYYSKTSQDLFKEVCLRLSLFDKSIFAMNNKWEFSIKYNDSKFFYDFKYKNKIIEFNGDMWHANPDIFAETDMPNPFFKISAKEIWAHDKIKNELAKNSGYEILIIWENDFLKNKEKIINNCIKFLTNDKR
jgi:hypothetical protein